MLQFRTYKRSSHRTGPEPAQPEKKKTRIKTQIGKKKTKLVRERENGYGATATLGTEGEDESKEVKSSDDGED